VEDDEEVEDSPRWLCILLLISILPLWIVDGYWLSTRSSQMAGWIKVNNAAFFFLGPVVLWEYLGDLMGINEHKQQ
jgi:hypothetical protein